VTSLAIQAASFMPAHTYNAKPLLNSNLVRADLRAKAV